ncbi:hypothetical protein NDU88_007639 [Pleurodeles waltl]|uniref:Uncharacterized protein n=1 Tax=Pleurodeles waltl TaxID=8319 RepID=A0AAV7RQ06_PLEWA|nr:hypothetical protein NDU88_007639 [Pleurodeles waltl]
MALDWGWGGQRRRETRKSASCFITTTDTQTSFRLYGSGFATRFYAQNARACTRQHCCLERSNGRVRLKRVRFPSPAFSAAPLHFSRPWTAVFDLPSVPGHHARFQTSSTRSTAPRSPSPRFSELGHAS